MQVNVCSDLVSVSQRWQVIDTIFLQKIDQDCPPVTLHFNGFVLQTDQNFDKIFVYLYNHGFDLHPHGIGQPIHNIRVLVVCDGLNKLKSIQIRKLRYI